MKATKMDLWVQTNWYLIFFIDHILLFWHKSTQTTYRSSFPWPKKSREVAPDIEPIIVAEKVIPGTAVPIHETGAKKSYTIPNLSSMVEKPDVSFAKETESFHPVVEKIKKKTEYKSKFRPFSAYVYVTGNGFIKPKYVEEVDKGKTQSWYSEVEERSRQANHYKTRSQLGMSWAFLSFSFSINHLTQKSFIKIQSIQWSLQMSFHSKAFRKYNAFCATLNTNF